MISTDFGSSIIEPGTQGVVGVAVDDRLDRLLADLGLDELTEPLASVGVVAGVVDDQSIGGRR